MKSNVSRQAASLSFPLHEITSEEPEKKSHTVMEMCFFKHRSLKSVISEKEKSLVPAQKYKQRKTFTLLLALQEKMGTKRQNCPLQ